MPDTTVIIKNKTFDPHRYGDAYIDYKHVLSVDMSALQASQGASRCQGLLQQRYGASVWREKIKGLVYVQPWEVPQIVSPGEAESNTTKPGVQLRLNPSILF